MIETVPYHYHGIVKSDVQFVTSKYDFQSKIWDPGTFNSRVEDNKIIWTDFISNNRSLFSSTLKAVTQSDDAFSFLWSEISDTPIDLLSSGNLLSGRKMRELIFTSDDDGDHFPWSEISSSPEIVQCCSQSQEDFVHPVHHFFKQQHELVGLRDDFFLLVRANQLQVMGLCLIPSISWWYWKFSLWQEKWVRRHPKEHIKYWSESLSMSISRRRQGSESSPTILDLCFQVKVMPMAFWSCSSMLIAPKFTIVWDDKRLNLFGNFLRFAY